MRCGLDQGVARHRDPDRVRRADRGRSAASPQRAVAPKGTRVKRLHSLRSRWSPCCVRSRDQDALRRRSARRTHAHATPIPGSRRRSRRVGRREIGRRYMRTGAGGANQTIRGRPASNPRATMIAAGPAGARLAPAVRAFPESVPFRDSTFDATLADLPPCTIQHDAQQGLQDGKAVVPRQVILSYDAVVELRLLAGQRILPPRSRSSTRSRPATPPRRSPKSSMCAGSRRPWSRRQLHQQLRHVLLESARGLCRSRLSRHLGSGAARRRGTGPRHRALGPADLASGTSGASEHLCLRTLRDNLGTRLIIAGDEVLDR